MNDKVVELDYGAIKDMQPSSIAKVKNSTTEVGKFLYELKNNEIAHEFGEISKEGRIVVIPIGFSQAGKTQLISSLMYYAQKGEDSLFHINYKVEFPYDKGSKELQEMTEAYENRVLKPSTPRNTLDLIGIDIHPNIERLKKYILKLAFLDIAGEDVKEIRTVAKGEFPEKIHNALKGLKIDKDKTNVIFMLITPYKPVQEGTETLSQAENRDDTLHFNFLNYLKELNPDLLHKCTFFVIASQWDLNPNREQPVEEFFRTKRPKIYQYVKNQQVIWGEYSIGEILVVENSDGSIHKSLERINHEYPRLFWEKLYHICMGIRLRRSWWERLFGTN